MAKLPRLSGRDLVKILSKIGYEHIRTRGSHMIIKKSLIIFETFGDRNSHSQEFLYDKTN